ncbi:MAG TPA: PIN domain-containing protein [Candidatus Sulfotelmatobacter sp.]|nr:PIN domain-containing protein [Candidatus Sulfotelmatobacter sp.]
MSDRVFFDSNVLIYAMVSGDSRREQAQQVIAQGGVISVQVLNEFVAVARRKMRTPWEDVIEALDAIRILFPSPVAITIETHEAALEIAQKYGLGIYDALIASAALEAACSTLYSEDLQDGQVINSKLTIRNPFR